MQVHLAAVSDAHANLTLHNLVANLEHSVVAKAALTLTTTTAPIVKTTVESLTLDSLLTDPQQHVAVLKVIMLKLVKAAVLCLRIEKRASI